MTPESDVFLFSYGSLQQPAVQRALFGRELEGRPDAMRGYRIAPLHIADAEVVQLSGAAVHRIAVATGDPADRVPGLVLSTTRAELDAADRYEVEEYRRELVRLESGVEAFAYVGFSR